jgi:hypothetical protein
VSGHHHPSLDEVIKDDSSYEWISLKIIGFAIGDYADAEHAEFNSSVSDPSFSLQSSACISEYGTYSFKSVHINLSLVSSESLEKLEGKTPLGLVNYYDPEMVHINLPLKPQIYNNLLALIVSDISLLKITVAIPIWKDKEAKCLPLEKYQVMYKKEEEI